MNIYFVYLILNLIVCGYFNVQIACLNIRGHCLKIMQFPTSHFFEFAEPYFGH